MKLLKKIYLPDPKNMLIWNEATNEVTNKKHEYISVEALKQWIEENYLRFSTMNDVIKFKKFISE